MLQYSILNYDFIYIIGKMCSGKTTVAGEIQKHIRKTGRPTFLYSLATPIKMVETGKLIEYALRGIKSLEEINDFVIKAKKIYFEEGKRAYNQFVGNDVIRKNNPTFFEEYALKHVFERITLPDVLGIKPAIIVDDVRWPVSVKILPDGLKIKVESDDDVKKQRGCDLSRTSHSSEQEVDDVPFDYIINNNLVDVEQLIPIARRNNARER